MTKERKFSVIDNIVEGQNVNIYDQVNLFKCSIGNNTKIDSFVYIEEGVTIGDNCKIRPFVFIPSGVKIGNNVFIGPHVTFTNDRYPKIGRAWKLEFTVVEDGVSIGASSVVLPGIKIGQNSLIGAGSIIKKNVPANSKLIGDRLIPL